MDSEACKKERLFLSRKLWSSVAWGACPSEGQQVWWVWRLQNTEKHFEEHCWHFYVFVLSWIVTCTDGWPVQSACEWHNWPFFICLRQSLSIRLTRSNSSSVVLHVMHFTSKHDSRSMFFLFHCFRPFHHHIWQKLSASGPTGSQTFGPLKHDDIYHPKWCF